MKITKYLHSCLLVEDQGKTILMDPGVYTVQDKALSADQISSLDYLLITHEHFDHMDIGFIKGLIAKFPQVKVISNESIKTILAKENITIQTTADDVVKIDTDAPHERIWGMTKEQMCQNIRITVFNRLTHPGDSLSFESTAEILALPVQAPWGSLTQAADVGAKLKPKFIIPIHDWHWKDDVRKQFYERLEQYFGGRGIKFVSLETGVPVEL